MNTVDELLEYVKKTNPEMTKNKLMEELKKSHSSTVCLLMEFSIFGLKCDNSGVN